jgi:glycolate oxidase FAD binding subunit
MTKIAREKDVAGFVREARESAVPFEIVGAATKRGYGKPVRTDAVLDVSGLRGILKYEPEELILTAAPGTPIAEIEAVLAARGQRLGFEPPDWAALFGAGRAATLGGVVSADAFGPARLRFGAARDSLLGFRGVNGFGQAYKAGGKVVKNVTGFDIPKLMCGAFGTLSVLTELTVRVFPKGEFCAVLAARALTPEAGFAALRKAWASALEPTGLAYVPPCAKFPGLEDGAALFRLEGAALPLKEKMAGLRALLKAHEMVEIAQGNDLFARIGAGAAFAGSGLDIWRIALPPSKAAQVAGEIAAPLWLGDLAGGLLWVGVARSDERDLHALAFAAGGYATLLCADAPTRTFVPVFPPPDAALEGLYHAVKAAFDPLRLFNPGRL